MAFNGICATDFKGAAVSTTDKVREFHKTFEHPIATRPTIADAALRALRVRLIAEELGEFARACGVTLLLSVDPTKPLSTDYLEILDRPAVPPDLVEMADALGDLDYVVQGANLALGIPGEAVVSEIHRSNMSKAGSDGKAVKREDGKILKGPNYSKPEIAKVLGVA